MSFSNYRNRRIGLSGVENCGPDQVWDPNVEFYGIKGQCMPRKNYATSDLVNPSAIPGVVKTKGAAAGSSGGILSSLFGALLANKTMPSQPAGPAYYPAPSSGISKTTMIVGGVVLAAGAYMLLKKD